MIKMEKNCSSLKCDVIHKGKKIGHMEGVTAIQWFLKNKYNYTGSFSKFITKSPEDNRVGIIVDIIFSDRKLIVRNARIQWIRSSCKNGTFQASHMEYYDP